MTEPGAHALGPSIGVIPMDRDPQISMFSRLPPALIREFLRTGCGQQEAELLVDIAQEAALAYSAR